MAEAEAEQEALNTEIEFVYYKANTFTEAYVDVELLSAVEARLEEIRKLQDNLVIKWLTHMIWWSEHIRMVLLA